MCVVGAVREAGNASSMNRRSARVKVCARFVLCAAAAACPPSRFDGVGGGVCRRHACVAKPPRCWDDYHLSYVASLSSFWAASREYAWGRRHAVSAHKPMRARNAPLRKRTRLREQTSLSFVVSVLPAWSFPPNEQTDRPGAGLGGGRRRRSAARECVLPPPPPPRPSEHARVLPREAERKKKGRGSC